MRVISSMFLSNQSILKQINPDYLLEGLMLKLQYFGHLMQRTDLLEKILMLEKIELGLLPDPGIEPRSPPRASREDRPQPTPIWLLRKATQGL